MEVGVAVQDKVQPPFPLPHGQHAQGPSELELASGTEARAWELKKGNRDPGWGDTLQAPREAECWPVTVALPDSLHGKDPGLVSSTMWPVCPSHCVACQSPLVPQPQPSVSREDCPGLGDSRHSESTGDMASTFVVSFVSLKKNIYFLNLITKVMHVVGDNEKNGNFFKIAFYPIITNNCSLA